MTTKTVSNIDYSKPITSGEVTIKANDIYVGEPLSIISICQDCGNIRFFLTIDGRIVEKPEELFETVKYYSNLVTSSGTNGSFDNVTISDVSLGAPSSITLSGLPIPFYFYHPLVCSYCTSDKPCYICCLGDFDKAGILSKCRNCKYRFLCATTRQEPEVFDF